MSVSNIENKYPELICSLTNELMVDPIITNQGISYERKPIETWLNNNKICPITNIYLDTTLLITNYTLKNLILKLHIEDEQEHKEQQEYKEQQNNNEQEHKEQKEYKKQQNNNKQKHKSENKVDEHENIYRIKINNSTFIKIIKNEFNYINIINNNKYFTGLGEYYINNNLLYIGEIKNNNILGNGEYYIKNRIKFKGAFTTDTNNNISINGYGIEYYKDGNIKYMGYFKNSEKDGSGIYYIAPNKILYEGQYKNNKRHGHGILYYYHKIDNNINKRNSDYLHLKRTVKSTFKNDLIWNYKNI